MSAPATSAPSGGVARPSVLVVGMLSSTHMCAFARLLEGSGWDVHLFDANAVTDAHPDLPAVTVHHGERPLRVPGPPSRAIPPPPGLPPAIEGQVAHLDHVIDAVGPDLVHAHETTLAGALVDRVRVRRGGDLGVPWLLTNWGSDLYWNGRDPLAVPRLRSVLAACPYYGAECHRDVALARAFGFRGDVIGVWPVAGGIDVEHARTLRAPGPVSARRRIALKGVAALYGQALVALDAVERCADLLAGWELCGYQMDDRVTARAAAVAGAAGMRLRVVSDVHVRDVPHDELLAMHGGARVSLGLNRSDGLSTSFLEAIAMGSFPVQARTACGYELTPRGRGALFVSPTDVDEVAAALRRALTDDALVDGAAALNDAIVAEHLDRRRIRARVLDAYERIVAEPARMAA